MLHPIVLEQAATPDQPEHMPHPGLEHTQVEEPEWGPQQSQLGGPEQSQIEHMPYPGHEQSRVEEPERRPQQSGPEQSQMEGLGVETLGDYWTDEWPQDEGMDWPQDEGMEWPQDEGIGRTSPPASNVIWQADRQKWSRLNPGQTFFTLSIRESSMDCGVHVRYRAVWVVSVKIRLSHCSIQYALPPTIRPPFHRRLWTMYFHS